MRALNEKLLLIAVESNVLESAVDVAEECVEMVTGARNWEKLSSAVGS